MEQPAAVSVVTADPPRAGAGFFKGHGLGNDYLVFPFGDRWTASHQAVRAVCDRWWGLGADGIVLHSSPDERPWRLRMFNPDGSEFERSGNGLRVFAACAASRGWIGHEGFAVEVGGDRIRMRVEEELGGGLYDVSVEMGRASLDPADAGLAPGWKERPLTHPAEGTLDCTLVSVGNPHCVVFAADLSEAALSRLGPFLTAHDAFPAGVNVQLVRPVSRGSIEIAIWERGVGRTLASGTSSCAAAIAAAARGVVDYGDVEVHMEGGTLQVSVSPELEVVLRGPVQEVASGRLSDGFLDALRSAALEPRSPGLPSMGSRSSGNNT
ncbi:MAG: diaminopimelate epimerase [Gammaproteobacteria bacterium]|nr:diaminopimelate epimerase [Gammaproteobacteria bacterium]